MPSTHGPGARAIRSLSMIGLATIGLALGMTLLGAKTAAASGSEGWVHAPFTPFQLAFGPGGAQVFDKETTVTGLRLSLLYGTQKKIYGIDLGLFSDTYGLSGIQAGLGNQVFGKLRGVQLGFANSADKGTGVQIGLLNRSHGMKGVQLGLINWHDEGFLPVFPFINFPVSSNDH